VGHGLNYDRAKGRADVIAGLTVAAVSFPQAMAYALIAGVDPKFGVYSAIVVTAVASIFGSSSHLINGPTSAISLLVFTSLAFIDSENTTELFKALFLLGALIGGIQILIGLFKLGNLTRYISEAVIIGFMAAAAFLLAAGQLGKAVGVRDKGDGHMQVLHRVWRTLFHGDPINYRAVTLSVAAVLLAVVLRKLVQRFRWPQVDMLAVLIITTLIAYVAGWSIPGPGGRAAVSVAGDVPRSLPGPQIPEVHADWLPHLSTGALAIAFVGIIEALSIAKAIAHEPRAWPTSPAGSSRACRARARCRDRRSITSPVRRQGFPGSSRPPRSPWRCCCSRRCCGTCRSRHWLGCCSSPPRGSSISSVCSTRSKRRAMTRVW
jgi:SulP family sulfate permease